MAITFPKVNGKIFDFSRVEIDLGGKIYTAFAGVKYKQPIEEGILFGAASEPLGRTRGQLQIGDAELDWSSLEESQSFIDDMGDGYLETEFTCSVTFAAPSCSPIKHVLFGCRLLSVEDDHSSGSDALGETMPFSFLYMTRNGKKSLVNQRF